MPEQWWNIFGAGWDGDKMLSPCHSLFHKDGWIGEWLGFNGILSTQVHCSSALTFVSVRVSCIRLTGLTM